MLQASSRRGVRWRQRTCGPCLESSVNLSSDHRLRRNGKVLPGAGGSKWREEAERLEPAALASARVSPQDTPNRWHLGKKEGDHGAGGCGLESAGAALHLPSWRRCPSAGRDACQGCCNQHAPAARPFFLPDPGSAR